MLAVDSAGGIRYRNRRACEWLPDEDSLKAAFEGARFLGPFEGWEQVLASVPEAKAALTLECALPAREPRAPTLVTLRCASLPEGPAGTGRGMVITIEESVRQAAVEDRLEVGQRLVSLGKLAARVAHELNNPLDGILRYINLAIRMLEASSECKLKSYLTESRTGLNRMVQIIGDLLEYSRTTTGEFDEMGINEVVEQAIRSSGSAAGANSVVVAADFHEQDMPVVHGSRLYQICGNLIKNAIDAMPDGGRLTVTTGVVNDQVVISVADTGKGLPDDPERLFEPFFTTKPPGKGTGLGLAICRDFVEAMDGTITASPGEEGGAVFTVRLPTSSFHRPGRLTGPPDDSAVATIQSGAPEPPAARDRNEP